MLAFAPRSLGIVNGRRQAPRHDGMTSVARGDSTGRYNPPVPILIAVGGGTASGKAENTVAVAAVIDRVRAMLRSTEGR